ncbi:MAG: NAD(P)H-dependent oxidoreductase [Tissierellia bacterium]|nr:NAD(P)H-dependent oxidoreductase [Tissierellia bacterium]
MKLSIIYYSQTGHNYQMVKWAEEEAKKLGAEVRVRKVHEFLEANENNDNPAWKKYREDSKDVVEASGEDLEWADAVLFSSPTRFGNIAFQMKAFLDGQGGLWAAGKLQDKMMSAMSSAQNNNGGQETTVQALYKTFAHWGSLIVPTGFTDDSVFKAGGNPYGTTATATNEGFANDLEAAVRHQTKRLVELTNKFIG